jgi:hypothetical protein
VLCLLGSELIEKNHQAWMSPWLVNILLRS